MNFKLKTMKKDKVHESNLLGEKIDGIKPNTFKSNFIYICIFRKGSLIS